MIFLCVLVAPRASSNLFLVGVLPVALIFKPFLVYDVSNISEQVVAPSTDFGVVWDTYFKTVEKAVINVPYSHIIWYYKDGKQTYFVGNMVENKSKDGIRFERWIPIKKSADNQR